jgi:methionyl-tRNA synthetase
VKENRQLLVTCALLYANGPLHLGHLLEHIQADIWVRFQRLKGRDCRFISGEDAHGTPIMLAAQKQGISPEALIEHVFKMHKADLEAFDIKYDHFGTTHCSENEELCATFYDRLQTQGHLVVRTVDQAYDPESKLFLPDRYIKGICPYCNTPEQYGDNCENCGATYNALELKEAISTVSGATPIPKPSEQYFLRLSELSPFLKNWITSGTLPEQAARKLLEWFDSQTGLQDLAISRESPYFGFRIPGTVDKYFYVWVDAPIGYMAIFKQLCQKEPQLDFDEYWQPHSKTELYHVIGKDIVKFHALFWPAILKGVQLRLPTRLFIHGFLTIDGRKMSKSRGTFITARHYLQHLNPEYLRYYFASKLNGSLEDIDLTWSDFIQKVNAELVGKLVNIASRCSKLLSTHCDNQLSSALNEHELISLFIESGGKIAEHFELQQYGSAIRCIMGLTDKANQYLDEKKPWMLAREEESKQEMQYVCTVGINLFKLLILYLKPILPRMSVQAEQFLNIPELTWEDQNKLLKGTKLSEYHPLLQRVSASEIEQLLEKSASAVN